MITLLYTKSYKDILSFYQIITIFRLSLIKEKVMDNKTIEDIKTAAEEQIVPIIGSYIKLANKGVDKIGKCPFHSDTHPSLHVSARKGHWKCFSCGCGGDAIDFVERIEATDYISALKIIADIVGIPVDGEPIKRKPIQAIQDDTSVQKQPIGEIPTDIVKRSLRRISDNVLYKFAVGFIGKADVDEAWRRYVVGNTNDNRCVYWYFDTDGVCRYGKVMEYTPLGHRTGNVAAIHYQVIKAMKSAGAWAQDYNPLFKPTLYGAHLVAEFPDSPIMLVESEKSAVLCSCFLSNFIWLATGSKTNLNPQILQPIKGREIFLCADFDAREEWSAKIPQLEKDGYDIKMFDWWSDAREIGEKDDICDILLNQCPLVESYDPPLDFLNETDEHPQLTAAAKILQDMMARNANVKTLVDSLGLEIVDEAQLPPLTPMQAKLSGKKYTIFKSIK